MAGAGHDSFLNDEKRFILSLKGLSMGRCRGTGLVVFLAFEFAVALSADRLFASSVPARHRSRSDKDINAIGHRKIARGSNFYRKNEAEIGKEFSAAFEEKTAMLRDPAIADYLARLTQKVARNSDADLPITVRVIDSDEVNAFTLPGGYQYVSLGLLLRLESEAELASVLARGIAHTALHSATREMTREAMARIGSIPLIFVGSGVPPVGKSANFLPLTLLSWRREDELDADYFGLQYVYRAGYLPECFSQALQRVWADDEAARLSVAMAFRPLPPLPDRLKAVQKEIAEVRPKQTAMTVSTPEFELFQEHLRVFRPKELTPKNPGSAAQGPL